MTAPADHAALQRFDVDRVAVLVLDCPDRSMNVVDEQVLGEFADHHAEILADDDVVALVLTSGKDGSFGAGADVDWLPELAARADADEFLADVHDFMVRLVHSPKPLVTALNGAAFGGALELALGGAAIVAVHDARLGLPEVSLGLLPGGGGTQLLSRWVPVAESVRMLTSGRPVGAVAGRDAGLVTRLADPDDLQAEAIALALGLADGEGPDRSGRELDPVGDVSAAIAAVDACRDELQAGRGGLTPAADRILQAVATGVSDGLRAGLGAERRHFLAALASPEARAALHLFRAERDVKRRIRSDDASGRVEVLGVVGGGQMGAGIAATAVSRGLTAVVQDVAPESLERAREYRDRVLVRTATQDQDPRAQRWSSTTAWEGISVADAVVEAVFEDPDLKRRILSEAAAQAGPDALVATNTSAIPIASLASAVPGADRFLGMHFFSPVDRMPLVELIPHDGTSADTRARAAALGRRLGKVPVVVGDAPGFFTSRVYARWLMEGIRLLLDGVPIEVIDDAATAVGFPVGPLRAHDEASLTLVVAASITQVAEPVFTGRLDVARVRAALESLCDVGITGRRDGHGFYAYADGRRTGPNPQVTVVLGIPRADDVDPALVGERLLYAFATECYACWDDGTLCHPDDGDVAAVLGIGFPRVLGGPFHWGDEVGAATMVARIAELGPDAFPPGETLARLATSGTTFADESRRPAPFAPPGS